MSLNPSTGPYPFASAVQCTALPSSGSYFFGWANAATGFANPFSLTVTNTNGLTALFGALSSNQVSLTILPAGNGTATVSPSANVFTNGETVMLTATPASNSMFSAWSGGVSSTFNPLTTILNGSEVITATFVAGSPTNPPVIIQPPLSRTLKPGSSSTLGVQTAGGGPFTYQWLFDAATISSATSSQLNLTNVTANQAGVYNVVVAGAGGSVTSTPASVALFNMLAVPSGSQSVPLLIVNGAPGTSYLLQYSASLNPTNWILLDQATLTGNTFYYVDTAISNYAERFYRAVPH